MAGEWQPISTAPTHRADLLVFCADTLEMFVAYRSDPASGLWVYGYAPDHKQICCRPSHWMRLPSGPEAA